MEKDKEQNNNKVIIANFKANLTDKVSKNSNAPKNQTNPILKNLLKLTHTELCQNHSDYKSFTNFKPEDLR